MSARDDLIDEYGRAETAPLGTLAELRTKLDAYRAELLAEPRAEVLREAAAEFEAACPDGPGPVRFPLCQCMAADELRRLADAAGKDTPSGGESARPKIPPLYVADYEGAPLTLHLTREAAREACDDVAKVDAHDRCWDWRTEEGDIDRQFWTHTDDDSPMGYTGGAVWEISVEQAAKGGIAR